MKEYLANFNGFMHQFQVYSFVGAVLILTLKVSYDFLTKQSITTTTKK